MKIRKGGYRIAILFPTAKLTIKIPRIYFKEAFKQRTWKARAHYLFWGILLNWWEFVFYLKTRHSFLQPTFLSLFGLLNIQRYGDKIPQEMWQELFQSLWTATKKEIKQDLHHFGESENFCLDRKRGIIRMLDYGHPTTQAIIQKWGHRLKKEVTKASP